MASRTPRNPTSKPPSRLRKFISTKTGKVTASLLAGALAGTVSLARLPTSQRAIVKKWRESAKLESMHRLERDARVLKDLRPSTLKSALRETQSLSILDKLVDKKHLDVRAAERAREELMRRGQVIENSGTESLVDGLTSLPDAEVQRRLENLYPRGSPFFENYLSQTRAARAQLEDYFLQRAQRVRNQVEQTSAASRRVELKKMYLRYLKRAAIIASATSAGILLLAAVTSVSKRRRA